MVPHRYSLASIVELGSGGRGVRVQGAGMRLGHENKVLLYRLNLAMAVIESNIRLGTRCEIGEICHQIGHGQRVAKIN